MDIKILKGTIAHTPTKEEFEVHEDSYIIVEDGKVLDIQEKLDGKYKDIKVEDYSGKLIIPGFVDTHLHATQYPNIGLGLDKELIPWLETYTFPEESKYEDIGYARKVFKKFINELWSVGTLRSVVFSSIHKESTELLLDMFIDSGLSAFVGKVNMDRNAPDYLIQDTETSLKETEEIVMEYIGKSELVKPIITPRFAPSCSDNLLEKLSELPGKHKVAIQSHLNENISEIEWVKELFPDSKDYASVYNDFNLFGNTNTIMAHCIYNTDDEIDLMAKNGVYAAHSPYSNYNLSSGIMPVRKYLDKGVNVGLASDISGGDKLSIADVMVAAIQGSKMVWLNSDKELDPLTFSESFYLGTKGGGKFFGKVGSFEKGYEFDALIVDDIEFTDLNQLTIVERLEKYIYAGDDRNIKVRYVAGEEIGKPF